MKSSRLGRLLAIAVGILTCGALLGATAAVGAPSAARRHSRFQLTGTKPSWAAPGRLTGAVAGTHAVNARVWLAPRNSAQLDALAREVSDPASSQYRKYISKAQYVARFAPTADQVAAVTRWLTAAGLRIDTVGPDNHYLSVSGSTAAINAAFATQLARYAVNGKQVQAPTKTLSVPSSLAGNVLSVTGLTKLGHRMKPADLGAPAPFVNGTPCSSYYGQKTAFDQPRFMGKKLPYAVCGYVPSQLRGAYGEDGPGSESNLGKGATIAITDAFDASTARGGCEHLLATPRRQEVRQGPVPGPELPGAAGQRSQRRCVRR